MRKKPQIAQQRIRRPSHSHCPLGTNRIAHAPLLRIIPAGRVLVERQSRPPQQTWHLDWDLSRSLCPVLPVQPCPRPAGSQSSPTPGRPSVNPISTLMCVYVSPAALDTDHVQRQLGPGGTAAAPAPASAVHLATTAMGIHRPERKRQRKVQHVDDRWRGVSVWRNTPITNPKAQKGIDPKTSVRHQLNHLQRLKAAPRQRRIPVQRASENTIMLKNHARRLHVRRSKPGSASGSRAFTSSQPCPRSIATPTPKGEEAPPPINPVAAHRPLADRLPPRGGRLRDRG